MTSRILMATVAALALSVPAAAQDQVKPLETDEPAAQQPLPREHALPDEDAAGAPAETGQPPATAADQPVEKPPEAQLGEDEEAPPSETTFIEEQKEAQFLAADEVIGQDVVNVLDEEVGEIADLVMDQEQQLVGVVLSVGGFLGIGEKWIAVPVDEIQFPTDAEPARLLVAVTKDQLKNAPDFVTRETAAAQMAAEEAQQRQMEQQQQIPPPATTDQ